MFQLIHLANPNSLELFQRMISIIRAYLHTSILQVVLGISTLLLVVPISLAAAHQAVAMLLFTVALFNCHTLSRCVEPVNPVG